MKKYFLFALVTIMSLSAFSQISVPKISTPAKPSVTDFIKPPAIGDITKTTGGIVDALSSQLSLPGTQKPALTSAVSSFLTSKSGIMGLASSNPTQYLSKFNPMQAGLFTKLKGIMGAAKFASFLKLKPANAGNALSNLFF
jgi:hypothetical protein